MAWVPKVRWQPVPLEPASPPEAAWRAARPLAPTVGPTALAGGAAALAGEVLGRDVWFASAGRVAVDAPAPPPGRVVALSGKAPRRRRTAKAAPAPKLPAPRTRGLPALPAPRRIAAVGPRRTGEEAPPLTALALPPGVVPGWETRLVELPPAPPPEHESNPEHESDNVLQAPEVPVRRVVRRVGLGAPLVAPPPRPVPREPEPVVLPAVPSYEEQAALVRTHPRRRLEQVPDDVRRSVEAVTGVDLGDVPVHRGDEVAHVARALRAHAFTVGGEVHLPAEHGPLSDPRVKALLAHELVHVAQQRRLGDELPPEDSPYGELLEQDALAVEGTWIAPQLAGVQRRALEAPAEPPARRPAREPADLPADDLEELAARLYGPIRARLRRELLVDRERAALLTDGRR